MVYGAAIEKEIIPFELDERNGPLKFRVAGQVSKATAILNLSWHIIFITNPAKADSES